MTVEEFVTDVLRNCGIINEIETPSAEQGQDAVTKLNDLMASLEEDGICFGFNPKSSTADDIVLPDGHRAALKAMLGVMLCDSYGQAPPAVMAALADSGYRRMLRQALVMNMRKVTTDAPRGERDRARFNILTGQ